MATKLGKRDFYVSTSVVDAYTGASDFNTNALDMADFSDKYIIYLFSTHTTGTPRATLQISEDGTNWLDYKVKSVLVALPESFLDDEFIPKFIRVQYFANSSNGNVTFFIRQNTE